MRPLRLTLEAFGPFAGREVIDFRQAIDAGLFGIYGATGSGKSTIFNAITFALFGEVSGSGAEDVRALRSDHADEDAPTRVELVFELGRKRYRVLRTPPWRRPKKRGEGFVEEAAQAWLFDVTGLKLDGIGDDHPGRAIAERKLTEVRDRVSELLGYGPKQFRQIVLLPQGKFEAFLAASSEDRKKILRDLFDVSLYRRFAESLKQEVGDLGTEIAHARAHVDKTLQAEGFETPQALCEGIAERREALRVLSEAARQAKADLKTAETAYTQAAQTDKAFADHAGTLAKLRELEVQRGAMAELKNRQRQLKFVRSLADLDQLLVQARLECRSVGSKLEAARRELTQAERDREAAGADLKRLEAHTNDVEAMKGRVHQFRSHAEVLTAAEGRRTRVQETRARLEELQKAAAEAMQRRETAAQKRAEAAQALETEQGLAHRRSELLREGAETHSALRDATAFARAKASLQETEAELEKASRSEREAEKRLRAARLEFEALEARLLADHAALLAIHLRDGTPCPVCGSSEHPAPARSRDSGTGIEQTAFEEARRIFEGARQSHQNAVVRTQACRERFEDRAVRLGEMDEPQVKLAELEKRSSTIADALSSLGEPADSEALRGRVQRLEAMQAEAAKAADEAQSGLQEARLAHVHAVQWLEEALQAVPDDFRSADRVEAELKRLEDAIREHASRLEVAGSREKEKSERLVASRAAVTHATQQLETANARTQDLENTLAARLAEQQLDAESYSALKGDAHLIEDFEAQIAEFDTALAIAQSKTEDAARALEGVDRPDLSALKARRDEAEAGRNAASKAVAEAAVTIDRLEKLHASLLKELERLEAEEQASGPLRELSKLVNGETGPKIDLETFAIGAMFDRVLDAANMRFGPMSRGRYRFMRDIDKRGGGRRGLGIMIDDAYTGRTRPTSTLSGGETFIAALALALGLSEVVESERGHVRLDTIFIDEGFGSLDANDDASTLDQVLQTLQDLVGARRTVGLISHVPVVQQEIPNGFYVTTSPRGSRIETRG